MIPGDLEVWCDGSGTLIDGPACVGVVIVDPTLPIDQGILCEASDYVGIGTNNFAELRAMRRGLYLAEQIGAQSGRSDVLSVSVNSDSEYAIGAVTNHSWAQRVHGDLINAIRRQVARLRVRFVHVEGHAGIFGNELADWLAGEARRRLLLTMGIERRPKRRPERDGSHKGRRPKAAKATKAPETEES